MATILWSAPFHVGCTSTALPIVLRLRDRGHRVVVQSVPPSEAHFRGLGFEFAANRRFPVYDFSSDGANDGSLRASSDSDAYQRWWRKLVRLQMADTLERLACERCDLVFGGSCMQLCGHGLAAEQAGIPWASYIDFLVDETTIREPEFPVLWDRWRAALGLAAEHRPPSESLWFPFSPYLVLYLVHPRLAFGPAPAYVRRVGASMWDECASAPEPEWLADLGVRRPAVLVSTSSLWQDDASLVTGVASAMSGENLDVVATVPAGHELPPVGENVIVTGQFPHSLLMPRVRCVVCSAGLGTVTRALCAGVPVVAVPRSGDGYNVARAAVRSGAGVALMPAQATPTQLGIAIERALFDDSIRRAAASFKGDWISASAIEHAADAVEALLS